MIVGYRQNYFGIHFDPGYNPGPETSVRYIDNTISVYDITAVGGRTIQNLSNATDISIGSSVTRTDTNLFLYNTTNQLSLVLIPNSV
jgi:hypothetical protein